MNCGESTCPNAMPAATAHRPKRATSEIAARSSGARSVARTPSASAPSTVTSESTVEIAPAAPTSPPVRFCEPDDVVTAYGPPAPRCWSETRADAARLSTCSGRPACTECMPEAARREPERERERDPRPEQRAAGRPPEPAAPRRHDEQHRQPQRGPELGGDAEPEQHAGSGVATSGERPQRARDQRDGPQVEARQRDRAGGRRPERDERSRRELHPARATERACGGGARRGRQGQARAHQRGERARVRVVRTAHDARRQDHREGERRVLDLHVAIGQLPVGEGVGIAQVGRRVDDLAVLPDAGVLHRPEPHARGERRREERDQRTREGAHSAIIAKGKNHGMYV